MDIAMDALANRNPDVLEAADEVVEMGSAFADLYYLEACKHLFD